MKYAFIKTHRHEHKVRTLCTVIGVHLTGPHASELIGEGTLAIEMGSTLEDLALAIHAHPTLSEQWGEAADLALGQPLHTSLAGGA